MNYHRLEAVPWIPWLSHIIRLAATVKTGVCLRPRRLNTDDFIPHEEASVLLLRRARLSRGERQHGCSQQSQHWKRRMYYSTCGSQPCWILPPRQAPPTPRTATWPFHPSRELLFSSEAGPSVPRRARQSRGGPVTSPSSQQPSAVPPFAPSE